MWPRPRNYFQRCGLVTSSFLNVTLPKKIHPQKNRETGLEARVIQSYKMSSTSQVTLKLCSYILFVIRFFLLHFNRPYSTRCYSVFSDLIWLAEIGFATNISVKDKGSQNLRNNCLLALPLNLKLYIVMQDNRMIDKRGESGATRLDGLQPR